MQDKDVAVLQDKDVAVQLSLNEANFARNEYVEIEKEHSRLRILALGIAGFVIPILVSLISYDGGDRAMTSPHALLSFIFLGLSFAYAMLRMVYVFVSARRSTVVNFLRRLAVENNYATTLHGPSVNEHLSFLRNMAWPALCCMLFIVPAIGSAIVALSLKPELHNNTLESLFITFIGVNIVIAFLSCVIWGVKKFIYFKMAQRLRLYGGR